MKKLIFFTVLITVESFGQIKTPKDFGFNHLQTIYQKDTIDILIKSKTGEENKPKPLFLFCQGSLPIPLIIYEDNEVYGTFPFNPDILVNDYHLVIIGKPYVPLTSDRKKLSDNFMYKENSGKILNKFLERDYLDYYVKRNIDVVSFLQRQTFISKDKLVIAGHSEGSSIAVKHGLDDKRVTHVIYSGGNPFGRIMAIVEQNRKIETDSYKSGEEQIRFWEKIIDNPSIDKTTYSFSYPKPIEIIKELKIPIYVCYGTKDDGTVANDYMRLEFVREKRDNVTFKSYIGTEHNYFYVEKTGEINYDKFNWDKVVSDWSDWLKKK